MRASRRRNRWVSAITILTFALPWSNAHSEDPPSGLYLLTADSSAAVGCLDLCDCPVWLVPELEGSFRLEVELVGATFTRYRVEDVRWVIQDETPIVARGSGTFEVRPDGEEEIETFDLLLSIDGGPEEAFSSARRVRDEAADEIHAAVRPTELVCFGQIFELRAKRSDAVLFVRSDCDADGSIDVGDAVRALFALLGESRAPPCEAACDTNGDAKIDIGDPVAVLELLFRSGPAPPPPFPQCGTAASPLSCAAFPSC